MQFTTGNSVNLNLCAPAHSFVTGFTPQLRRFIPARYRCSTIAEGRARVAYVFCHWVISVGVRVIRVTKVGVSVVFLPSQGGLCGSFTLGRRRHPEPGPQYPNLQSVAGAPRQYPARPKNPLTRPRQPWTMCYATWTRCSCLPGCRPSGRFQEPAGASRAWLHKSFER